MGFTTGMINREDFEVALKWDTREPVSADVTYPGQKARSYTARDFGKIRFPVQKLTIRYAAGSGRLVPLGNGDFARADKRKVRS